MSRCYVYCHCFADTKEIFYIGKGTGARWKSPYRSETWKRLTKNRAYFAVKIRQGLTDAEAFDFENELLQEFDTLGNINKSSSKVKVVEYHSLSKIVKYDETSPTFLRYLVDRANGAIKAGSIAGSFDSDGYGQVYIKDKLFKAHRIVYCLCYKQNVPTDLIVDHIDGNKSNNNIKNLRLVDFSTNTRNIDWAVVKPTNTGERAISLRACYYRVCWTEYGKPYEKSFSFGVRSGRTKEQAFELAKLFRDTKITTPDCAISGIAPKTDRGCTQNPSLP